MRKWLLILFLIGIFYVLSWMNKNKLQKRYAFLKRLDLTLTIAAWTILIVYGLAFLYWVYKLITK
ncbi:MAG: hypothetical protein JXB26_08165 [Candidatus Aminicenantes bacterium]|nr:hypothetical protein [Candidatus Aminicenantes bacterium]